MTVTDASIPRGQRTRRGRQLFDQLEAKPPYRVPLVSEIAKIRPNGFKVATTFAGCGGSSLGYRMAGFQIVWANEFVPAAQESYRANMGKGTVLDGRDIKEIDPSEILAATGLGAGDLDLFDGSPPCQAFSTAGKREKGWGKDRHYEHGASQKNEDLFFEFVRLRDGLMPRVFVAENVSGLVKGVAKGYFIEILRQLKIGYRVETRLVDAQWLGVPQQRQRVIFVGVRDDLAINPVFPVPLPYRYSVRDALPWLGEARTKAHGFTRRDSLDLEGAAPTVTCSPGKGSYQGHEVEERLLQGPEVDFRNHGKEIDVDYPIPTIVAWNADKRSPRQFQIERVVYDSGRKGQPARDILAEPAPTITAGPSDPRTGGGPRNHFKVETETDISKQAIGREYDRLNPGQQSDKYFSLIRVDPGKPSPTLTASGGQNSGIACAVHPTEKRKFSIAELKRLCAFPDDFDLKGTYAQQWERCGNSVPPVMMRHVAAAIRDGVLIPARDAARSAARDERSSGRSTSDLSRKGAGTRRPRRRHGARSGE